MHLTLPVPTVSRKCHESATGSAMGRGVSNGSAASCQCESQEGRSHVSLTAQIKLVAHPVGRSGECWDLHPLLTFCTERDTGLPDNQRGRQLYTQRFQRFTC